jgi:hypothetical protein
MHTSAARYNCASSSDRMARGIKGFAASSSVAFLVLRRKFERKGDEARQAQEN